MLSRRALRALSWAPFVESVPATVTPRHPCPFSVVPPLSTSSARHNGALPLQIRHSSSSSKRWQTRQGRDRFAKEAKVQGLKSRAAFKLLEINERYKIFKKGQTVVDLGYAPGSWSQVVVDLTQPRGRILGIDIIPAQPPRGVSTIQGNFLSPLVQEEVKKFLLDPDRGRPHIPTVFSHDPASEVDDPSDQQLEQRGLSYLELERRATHDSDPPEQEPASKPTKKDKELELGHTVDVLLSDMCAPWPLTDGLWKQSLSRPYYRMVNTSGIGFKDHAGSMDLCHSALAFGYDTLKIGGSFVCKFYMGAEDKVLEERLKRLFRSVYREKPESSRSESREAYFVALRRRDSVKREDVVGGS